MRPGAQVGLLRTCWTGASPETCRPGHRPAGTERTPTRASRPVSGGPGADPGHQLGKIGGAADERADLIAYRPGQPVPVPGVEAGGRIGTHPAPLPGQPRTTAG